MSVSLAISSEMLPEWHPECAERENEIEDEVDWLQSAKQFFINVSYHILVACLTLMALF